MMKTIKVVPVIDPAPKPEELRTSISYLIKYMEDNPENAHSIAKLSKNFLIKRRRLYDIINVFESIGCCEKVGLDVVKWVGLDNIKKNIAKMKTKRQIFDYHKSLQDLFPVPCCVGITNLTSAFILLFFAIQQNSLDLRSVSQFFSRDTRRYKTTLCKLYQISYILAAVGVVNRTNHVCEVILKNAYYTEEKPCGKSEGEVNPINLTSYLNSNELERNECITKRRQSLLDCLAEVEKTKLLVDFSGDVC